MVALNVRIINGAAGFRKLYVVGILAGIILFHNAFVNIVNRFLSLIQFRDSQAVLPNNVTRLTIKKRKYQFFLKVRTNGNNLSIE